MSLGYVWVICGTWGFKRECDLCCLPIFPLRGLQRGSNALLIYHSSTMTVWSSPDDPHLVPPCVLVLPLSLGLNSIFAFPHSVVVFFSVLAHLCIWFTLFSSKVHFYFYLLAPLYFTLTSIHLSQISRMLFSIFQQQCLWTSFPCLSLSSLF